MPVMTTLWMQPRISLAFWAVRAHCQLSFLSIITPSLSLQGCSQSLLCPAWDCHDPGVGPGTLLNSLRFPSACLQACGGPSGWHHFTVSTAPHSLELPTNLLRVHLIPLSMSPTFNCIDLNTDLKDTAFSCNSYFTVRIHVCSSGFENWFTDVIHVNKMSPEHKEFYSHWHPAGGHRDSCYTASTLKNSWRNPLVAAFQLHLHICSENQLCLKPSISPSSSRHRKTTLELVRYEKPTTGRNCFAYRK
ncbi:uncharacterized protein LOC107203155 isoform X2 [Parus major]|uniref:uncharacterized protein LOC107203155 isoform X2 n=1 Tax=Parus major TaxID=9157 RepID=UPI0007710C4F|nr:uncharacterized protein LOC107203155 isoform X2 [Parus major]